MASSPPTARSRLVSALARGLWRPRLAPRWAAVLVGLWAVHALALALLTRWFEIAFGWVGAESEFATVSSASVGGAVLPLAALLMGGVAWVVFRAARVHPGVATGAGLFAMLGIGGALTYADLSALKDAWTLPTASAMVGDAMLVIVAALIALMALTLARGPLRKALVVVFVLLGGATLAVQVVAFTYVVQIRGPMDPHVLWYTLSTLGELLPVIGSEATPASLALLGGWAVLTVLPVLVLAFPAVRQRLERAREASGEERAIGVGGALWTALPVLAVLAALPPSPPVLGLGALSRIAASVGPPGDTSDPEQAAAHLFDSREAQFVPIEGQEPLAANVIVVVLESHRRDAVTPYAPDLATTPFLDSLAQSGLLVEDMFAVVPHTNKSIVSIFGGVYPRLTPDFAANKPGGLPARGLAALLKDHGYATSFFTPATMEYEEKGIILDNLGFEERYGDGDYAASPALVREYFGYEDRVMLDSAHAWVDRQVEAEQPFFLGMLTLTSHHPYRIPDAFPRRRFSEDPERDEYLNSIRYTDAFLRDFWRGIERRGLGDSTLLVVVSDHGEAFGEHGARLHSDVIWDEALAVPAVITGPGIEPGLARGPRSLVDVVQTVADALGYTIEGAQGLPGRSLLQPVPDDRAVYHGLRSHSAALAVRRGTRKVIVHSQRPAQVFDLSTDPDERIDLAADGSPEVEEEARRAGTEARAWRDGVARSYADHAARQRQTR